MGAAVAAAAAASAGGARVEEERNDAALKAVCRFELCSLHVPLLLLAGWGRKGYTGVVGFEFCPTNVEMYTRVVSLSGLCCLSLVLELDEMRRERFFKAPPARESYELNRGRRAW